VAGSEEAASEKGDTGDHPGLIEKGGTEDDEIPQEILKELARVVGNHWVRGYEVLGPVTTTAGVVIMGISVVEMLAGTRSPVRAAILYTQKGPVFGCWPRCGGRHSR
jgi:hypothetical protein